MKLLLFFFLTCFASDVSTLVEKYKQKIATLQADNPLALSYNKVISLLLNEEASLLEIKEKLQDQESGNLDIAKISKVIQVPFSYTFVNGPGKEQLINYEELIENFDKIRTNSLFSKPKKKKKSPPKTTQSSLVESRASRQTNPQLFQNIARVIRDNKSTFMDILTQVDNYTGAKYEIDQILKTLQGVEIHERPYLDRVEGVDNTAIYGSRNIPFYTLIMHAIIPSFVSKNVWFRTPEKTRNIYTQLFEKIKEYLPLEDLDNIHMLTLPKDVQYDNFRKKYVLGAQTGGKPANIVVFVGSPETADKIEEEVLSKISQHQDTIGSFKQVFMKFGSGLNPVVITELAGSYLDKAIKGALDSVKINNGQDCIAPKFYAIHHTLKTKFLEKLMSKIGKLRFGDLKDPNADISPLSYTEDLTPLVNYKEKFKKYLINKNAKIDLETRQVDPHVFQFPFKMFAKVDLVDHYAPFLILFEYHVSELKNIVSDPRVSTRAMYASLYGDNGEVTMWQYLNMFASTFHTVTKNQSVYFEESGVFPFGGFGGTSSSSTLLQNSPDGVLRSTFHRPLLYSKEAKTFFPKTQSSVTLIPEEPLLEDVEFLNTQIQRSQNPQEYSRIANESGKEDWKKLNDPMVTDRPRGIESIRQLILENGVASIVHCKEEYPGESLETLELLFGTQIICMESLTPGQLFKEVILHTAPVNREVPLMNAARGVINPFMGFGLLTPLLSSKYTEYITARAISPSSMPKGESYSDLLRDNAFSEEFLSLYNQTKSLLDAHLKGNSQTRLPQLKKLLKNLISQLFATIQERHPIGTYVKNYGELSTGDLGNQLTSFHFDLENMVEEFLNSIKTHKKISLNSTAFNQLIESQSYETGTKFIAKLLTQPNTILFQERVKIEQTQLGANMEFRVDYLDGEAVLSKGRFTSEYLRKEEQESKEFLNDFFKKAPKEFRYLSGGADVAKLENGRWIFIEFNTGANSGTLAPGMFPIDRNLYMSSLLGKKTPFIQKLEDIFNGPLSEQKLFLKDLKQEEELWYKEKLSQISLAEYAKWFRDRYLDEWRKDPTPENADLTLKTLKTLFDNVGSKNNIDLPLLIRQSEEFFKGELLKH